VAQVLVDPSCSGSGMRREHSAVIEESAVAPLVQLQTSVLRHALAFPSATRVVYRCAAAGG
jgi:16S rRNA C967 or C1407 C5-methylase (RsmB/RsmF family)